MANATVGDVGIPESTRRAPTWPRDSRPASGTTGIDLDSLFILHKGNLAVIHEAQAVIADAVQEIVRVQCSYVERFLADAKAALLGRETVRPGATLVRSASTAKEVVELAVAAQTRVGDLLTRLARANLDEVRLLTR
ncbi:MAG: hypothetical protein ACJ8H8_08445 [Geminicoccaceae bacterium]